MRARWSHDGRAIAATRWHFAMVNLELVVAKDRANLELFNNALTETKLSGQEVYLS